MIYDRTIQDVIDAEQIFNEKIKQMLPLTAEEENILEKGRVTATTLNRIENKQAELASLLNDEMFVKVNLQNKSWSNQVFFQEDLRRLVDNSKALRDNFFVISAIENPSARFYFEDFNKIEKILAEVEAQIANARKSFRRSGSFSAGQSVLPQKGEL